MASFLEHLYLGWWELFLLILAAGVLIYMLSWILGPAPLQLKGRHVLVAGGSMGIGEECAIQAASEGARISLLARGSAKLAVAQARVEAALPLSKEDPSHQVVSVAADATDWEATKEAVEAAVAALGPVDVLLCCVGVGTSTRLDEVDVKEMENLVRTNLIAPMNLVKAVVPSMKGAKKPGGRILVCSSAAGLIGVYGYAPYTAAKRGLVGLAEVLQQELSIYSIRMSVAYPPDTDTPGFAEEQKTKPALTRLISESSSSVFTSREVAASILSGVKRGDFNISIGFDTWMLSQLNAGTLPQPFLWKLLVEMVAMPILRPVSLVYKIVWHRMIRRWHVQQHKAK